MKESRFVLVGNGSYLNKGCEAIVRGTVHILRNAFGESRFYNANFDVQNPPYMPAESDSDIVHMPVAQLRKWSPMWAIHQALVRVTPNAAWDLYLRDIIPLVRDARAVLSIGGDNYTLDYSAPKAYIALNNFAKRHGNPLVIWGASIGPFDSAPVFAEAMHKHLKTRVKAIFVRERRSQQYLAKYGIVENVYLVPDPAFVMEPEACGVPEIGFDLPKGAVGINLSPQIKRAIDVGKKVGFMDEMTGLVERIRKCTARPIILIPHVTSPHSNDYGLLAEVYGNLKSTDDIYLVPPNLNAAQTKDVISRLGCLVAARTHATIGAFSTCVPTVSLAYSAKAHGINEMLFGHQDFVVPLEEFGAQAIEGKVLLALDRADEIQEVLASKMDDVKIEAMSAGRILSEVLDQ